MDVGVVWSNCCCALVWFVSFVSGRFRACGPLLASVLLFELAAGEVNGQEQDGDGQESKGVRA